MLKIIEVKGWAGRFITYNRKCTVYPLIRDVFNLRNDNQYINSTTPSGPPPPPPSLPLNSFGVDAQDLQLMPAFNQFIRGVIQAINKPICASHMK